MFANNPLPTTFLLSIITVLVTGCPDSEDPLDPCANGGDEVGDDDCETIPPGDLASGKCILNEDPNVDGHRVQCEGEFHSKIDFHIGNLNCADALGDEFCSQIHPFGPPFDTYEAPEVMACCGEEWDPVLYLDTYQDSCMYDLGAQACATMAIRLEKSIEAGDFKTPYGDFTKKAKNLHAYIESHLVECREALYDGDTSPAASELVSHWNVPNKNGPKGWWPAKDIVLSVGAGTSVFEVHRPDEKTDWLECHGTSENDDEVFEDHTSPKGSILVGVDLDASVDGTLIGPVIGGSRVTSSMTFDTNCVDQGCPGASWSYASGTDPGFTMEDLRLYAAHFELSSSTAALTIERARVELWKQAPGSKILAPGGGVIGYEIPAGQAWFYVAGMTNGVFGRYMAVNSTDIEITEDRGMWTIGAFDIESIDGADRTWTLTLDDSMWRR